MTASSQRTRRVLRTAAAVALSLTIAAVGASASNGAQQTTDPQATLLYQNFPNPFPTPTNRATCVWFDLRVSGQVRLDVFTLRGVHVRSLVPGRDVPGRLGPGRFGRGPDGIAGCDPRFSWDGTGDDGREAPAGVYLIRLRADGQDAVRKALFQGR